MASPSSLPSAVSVAHKCHDKYRKTVDPTFDPALRDHLENMAEHFAGQGTLKTTFIRRLVPWSDFVRPPNPGHKALGDFLVCRAVFAVLSANYDALIEIPARENGADVQIALDGDQANVHSTTQSPLLKFHGCAQCDRDHTVWTKSQLTDDEVIAERIERTARWMEANLREKDILLVGFWSDWSYLNSIIESAFEKVTPLSVFVVDPAEPDELKERAPKLWKVANSDGVSFSHIKKSGSDVLNELRRWFSAMYIRQVLLFGQESFEQQTGVECDPTWFDTSLSEEDQYRWRRDAEGRAPLRPPKRKRPERNEVLGFFHLLLRQAGATITAEGYSLNGQSIRVVDGSKRMLSSLQQELIEPPAAAVSGLVVCVGSEDLGLPGNIVRSGEPGSILRPGQDSLFVTHQTAREMLGI